MREVGLFSPIKIKTLELPNRIMMSPMFSNSAGDKGVVTQNTINHYVDRARSGVGLIMTEHTSVSSEYIHPGKRLQISEDYHVEGLKKLADAVHDEGCKIGLQIAHSIHGKGMVPSDLTNEDCYKIIDDFVEGARRAKEAGFDAIELHYAHTYTMADFISRRTNTRTDEFGGDVYGRMFIHIEILKRIRALVGGEYPIFARISAEEFIVGGNTLVQTRIFAKELEKYGVDCLDVSAGVRFDDGGLKGYSDQRGKPTIEYPDGPNVYLAEDIKKHISIPVITVGKLGNPDVAKEVIETGRADMVALARPLIADSMWVKKVKADRYDLIKSCLYCNECLYERHDPEAYVHCMRYTCQNACPANVEVPVYIDLTYQGNYLEAYKVIQSENPFPLACGRICNHVCESLCNRVKIDKPISIKNIKRYATDKIIEENIDFPVPEIEKENNIKVAVVGSGPSGLSSAFYLRKKGYDVTVYEASDRIGGMLVAGIPAYRLPKDLLEKEFKVFKTMGIKFITNTTFGKDITKDELLNAGFKAIYLGIGAQGGRKLNIPGEDVSNVISGVEFLNKVSKNENFGFQNKNVVVIGGGNVAMDAARTAVRLGSSTVKLFCLENRKSMPASIEEIEYATEEGVFINNSWGPKQILCSDGKAHEIIFKECESVINDGRFNPKYNENNEIIVKVDFIISAIGQSVDCEAFASDLKEIVNPRGISATFGGFTNLPYIFSGGDCTAAPASVVKCSNDGKLAASSIDKYLGGNGQVVSVKTHDRVMSHGINEELQERQELKYVALDDMEDKFLECEIGLSEEQLKSEALRCLRCDVLKCNKL